MRFYITEILEKINKDPKEINNFKDNQALKSVFEYSFNPEKAFHLPEGTPPYKPDSAPLGMSPANFYQETRRFYVFLRDDLTPAKREGIFINLLESLHPSEAKLLIAIKDQKLKRLYKNVTHKLAYGAGLVSCSPAERLKNKEKKEKDGVIG